MTTTSAAFVDISSRRQRSKKRSLVPLNVLVVGRARTGKTTFVHTLLESIKRENASIPNLNNPNTSKSTNSVSGFEESTTSLPFSSFSNSGTTSSTLGAVANGVLLEQAGFEPMPTIIVESNNSNSNGKQKFSNGNGDASASAPRVQLTLVDSVAVETVEDVSRVVSYVRAHYDAALAEELKVRRDTRNAYRSMVHSVIYLFEAPVRNSHAAWRFDVAAMRALAAVTNVVPALARSDGLTRREVSAARLLFRSTLDMPLFSAPFGSIMTLNRTSTLSSWSIDEGVSMKRNVKRDSNVIFGEEGEDKDVNNDDLEIEEDEEEMRIIRQHLQKLPLALFGAEIEKQDGDNDHQRLENVAYSTKSSDILGREYMWGSLEVDKHSDMPVLRRMLFHHGLESLLEYTREVLYEDHRARRLSNFDDSDLKKGNSSLGNEAEKESEEEIGDGEGERNEKC